MAAGARGMRGWAAACSPCATGSKCAAEGREGRVERALCGVREVGMRARAKGVGGAHLGRDASVPKGRRASSL